MKIITINNTDEKVIHIEVDEDNHRNNIEDTNYNKSAFTIKELVDLYLKKYEIKNYDAHYDWAGVMIIEH